MGKKVKIIVDSGCDLTRQLLESLNVDIIPLNISFGAETFLDYVDLTPEIMLDKLKTMKENPKTSAPGIAFFKDKYLKYINEGFDLCVFCLSSAASSTYDVACMAKKEVEKEMQLGSESINIIDTRNFTMGYGIIVRDAAKMALDGADIGEVLSFVNERVPKTKLCFCVSDLSYLKRGGRIRAAEAFIGGMLGIVPVMVIKDGLVVPAAKERGMKRALNRIVDVAEEDGCIADENSIVIMECGFRDKLDMFHSVLAERLGLGFTPQCFSLHGTIAAHTGPGALGIAYYCS